LPVGGGESPKLGTGKGIEVGGIETVGASNVGVEKSKIGELAVEVEVASAETSCVVCEGGTGRFCTMYANHAITPQRTMTPHPNPPSKNLSRVEKSFFDSIVRWIVLEKRLCHPEGAFVATEGFRSSC
jgi:hypothetical protein